MKKTVAIIEQDEFPFEFLSQLAERESWRKEVHRPIYHVHKWWAKRLGSVFRGILLGCVVEDDLESEYYQQHDFSDLTVFDPFMGSGTTIGEAHKLGFTSLGREINPVAVDAVRVAFGPLDRGKLERSFEELSKTVGPTLRALYRSKDSQGRPCDVLYRFWVMQVDCSSCGSPVDLFRSWVFARNAYPKRKPEVQVVCPECGEIFKGMHGDKIAQCPAGHRFDPDSGPARNTRARCQQCSHEFSILDAVAGKRPNFRQYAKLVLTENGEKQYLRTTKEDGKNYKDCSRRLQAAIEVGDIELPRLSLQYGVNTRQAMSYGFHSWKDFFNDRQLLALSLLRSGICKLKDVPSREALLTLFSSILEFNNVFASYKGEGTGAVRHMFAHHILKPERVPIEANVWGTPRSSGSFTTLFKRKLLRAVDYRNAPTEVIRRADKGIVCSRPFTGEIVEWPTSKRIPAGTMALSCGDSAKTKFAKESIDLIVTDPPFFDNVHYSELADFFYAWRHLGHENGSTTRCEAEVQDADASRFAAKLRGVFSECYRVLKPDGLLVFSYHHSREDGWKAVADAVLGAGFVVVNSHPVKSEMSVATPKSQAKEPIQIDIILVCRKHGGRRAVSKSDALQSAQSKISRMVEAGFKLSRNDCRVITYGQLLTSLQDAAELATIGELLETGDAVEPAAV